MARVTILTASTATRLRALAGILLLGACAGALILPPKVRVVAPRHGEAMRVAHAATTVEAIERAEVKSRVQGTISEILVREGDRVEKDQVLARLTAPSAEMEFNRARRDVDALDAQISGLSSEFSEARAERERLAKLSSTGSISTAELERARSRLAVLQAQLTGLSVQRKGLGSEISARSSVAPSGAVGSRDLEIRAPRAGIVLRRNIDLGAFTTPAHSAFVVGTLDALAVDAVVDETDIPYIRRDTEVWLSFRVLPDRTLRGRIVEIPQDANRDLQAFVVKVEILEPPLSLRPGMSGEAAFILERHAQATLVPSAAVSGDHKIRVVRGARMHTLNFKAGIVSRTETEWLGGEDIEAVAVGPEPLPPDGTRVRVEHTTTPAPLPAP